MAEPTPGRRALVATRRRPAALDVLAVLIPLVTVGALALVRPAAEPVEHRASEPTQLHRTTLVCPAALPGADDVSVASLESATGELTTRGEEESIRLTDGVAVTDRRDAVAMTAEGQLAPGLAAWRHGAGSATACPRPAAEVWFTGVGAAPEHSSVLELVNPDGGPAVADVTVLGPTGEMTVASLRGVTVAGGRTERFDLARLVPTRDELALRVRVPRGRLGVHVVDVVDELGLGARSQDWLPAQAEPLTTSHLLGLGSSPGGRVLSVANPGDSEARVQIDLLTRASAFAPAGVEELRVPPGSVVTTDLGRLLSSRVAQGALGLRLTATQPVTSSLRTLAAGDLSHAVPGEPLEGRAGAVLPPGPKRLLLSGAEGAGTVTWLALDERGREVAQETVRVSEGTSQRIALPPPAAVLDVRVEDTTLLAALEMGPPGLAVVPLAPLPLTGEVPDVRPALQ
ncbi:hypothetical protein DDE18_07135 [Nocardioides gansuensis]|uniref:Secreted protein n=1 Tax=Nocardioides gansuensis TaxID=2138300 RepID=A0A2T8FBL9_9ACTN|nr:DUF5719 family protein [Nocardioides gansuensis]PVG83095.1 hypothetical protein DDE18_07135 [Nocardioides gansuensis]